MKNTKKPSRNIQLLMLCAFLLLAIIASPHFSYAQMGASDALIKRARDHINLFQYDQARSLLMQAIQAQPDNFEPYYLIGRALIRQKKEAEAENFLKKALELNPSHDECRKALGAVYVKLARDAQATNKTAQMAEYIHQACRTYPEGTKMWLNLLEIWWNSGEYDKIIAEGDLIVSSNRRTLQQGDDKNLQSALVIVARTHFRKGDYAAAERFIKDASSIKHSNEELYSMRRDIRNRNEERTRKVVEEAQTLLEQGNFQRATELIQEALRTGGSSSELQELLAQAETRAAVIRISNDSDRLAAQNKMEEALNLLSDAALRFPEETEITTRLTAIHAQVDELKAKQAEERARKLAARHQLMEREKTLNFYNNEAREHERNKDYSLAAISYEKALDLDSDNEELKAKISEMRNNASLQAKRLQEFSIAFAQLESHFSANRNSEAWEQGQTLYNKYTEHRDRLAPLLAETALKLNKFDQARNYAILFEDDTELSDLYSYICGVVAYQKSERNLALEHFKNIRTSSFRPGIFTIKIRIYLYKFQVGIYIFMLILLFPAIRMVKDMLKKHKERRILNKIDAIKQSGKYEQNLDFLAERFTKEDTANPKQIAIMYSEALLRNGQTQRSYEIISNLLKKDSRNPHAKRIAGEACLKLEDSSPMGLEHIQNLYKIDETRKDVVSFLAKTYMRLQADHKLAQDFILKYISLYPSDAEALVFMADLIIKKKNYSSQTVKILERTINTAPEVPEYYCALIDNYRHTGNEDDANKVLETARNKFPAEPMFDDQPPDQPTKPTSPAHRGAFPDYDSIGAQPTGQTPGGYPDYDSIGNTPPPAPPAEPASGPTHICPHCQHINSIKEYYCLSCGKSLAG